MKLQLVNTISQEVGYINACYLQLKALANLIIQITKHTKNTVLKSTYLQLPNNKQLIDHEI